MRAVAVTDHGVMHGIFSLFQEVKKLNEAQQKKIKELEDNLSSVQSETERAEIESKIKELMRPLFKPIAGCEAYVAPGTHTDRNKGERPFHLVLLAKNYTGYQNLCRLNAISFDKGFYSRPRIDMALLRQHSEGLIASSACLAGAIPKAIDSGDFNLARRHIAEFKEIFGNDFYLELMLHPPVQPGDPNNVIDRQITVAAGILRLAQETKTRCIITNDVHFLHRDDAPMHDLLLCISTNKKLSDENRLRYTHQEYFKSEEEIRKTFSALYPKIADAFIRIAKTDVSTEDRGEGCTPLPETLSQDEFEDAISDAIATTGEIADAVEHYSLLHDPIMPNFPIPEGFKGPNEYLRHLVYEGAKERWGNELPQEYIERLDFELSTIERMNFPGYFLIVWDFIAAARERDVAVGPGRGSAAGSAVAYCLQITNVDPFKYGLLFERFLNPDRISLPDIDIDFEDSKRSIVIDYVREKYGYDCVAGVATFNRLKPKSAVNDVIRALETDKDDSFPISKAMRESRADTFEKIYKEQPELKEIKAKGSTSQRDVLDYAEDMEGLLRSVGQHACGFIIGREPLSNFAPLFLPKDSDSLCVQFEGSSIESIGLIKMDFLGLKTLQILTETQRILSATRGIEINLDELPLDDVKTFELFSRGETVALFQFESPGMQKYLRQLKPDKLEDLIAMNALYRPGPMDNIDRYIKRKFGIEKVTYDIPQEEEVLAETYGITVYQEQVMRLSRILANFSPGKSDKLRKAMGKKKRQEMDPLKEEFLEGCRQNGHPEKKVLSIWNDWEKFAEYAFNKSHSTCYAYLAYQTGYLKAHYPSEFMAANMQVWRDNAETLKIFTQECQRMGIQLLIPDINESTTDFVVLPNGNIRYGLTAIKGVGKEAMETVVLERETNGPFADIFDLVQRVPTSTLNKRNLEFLAYSGAFDSITPDGNRAIYFQEVEQIHGREAGETIPITFLDKVIQYAQNYHKRQSNATPSLFGDAVLETVFPTPEIPRLTSQANPITFLNMERELIGLYVSAHPLDKFEVEMNYLCTATLSELNQDLQNLVGQTYHVGGIVSDVNLRRNPKNNSSTLLFTLEDYTGNYTFRLFGQAIDTHMPHLTVGNILFLTISIRASRKAEYGPNIFIELLSPMENMQQTGFRTLEIQLDAQQFSQLDLEELSRILPEEPSPTALLFEINDPECNRQLQLSTDLKGVKINKERIKLLQEQGFNFKINGRSIQQKEVLLVSDIDSEMEAELEPEGLSD